MTAFAVYDSVRGIDVSEHPSLAEAYKEIHRLERKPGGEGRYAVRLASQHRQNLERQAAPRKLSFV